MSATTARVALCQMKVTAAKAANLAKATAMVAASRTEHKADVVILPECFNCPYGTKYFPQYAEPIPPIGAGPDQILADAKKFESSAVMCKAAVDNKVWLIGGSIPEEVVLAQPEEGGEKKEAERKIYNSALIFSPDGVLRAVHRKIHLFCLRSETVTMDEGEVLTAGDTPTVVDVVPSSSSSSSFPNFKVGVGICFDIRFPQLALLYQQQGTSLLVYPGAFSMVTGPPHWMHSAKARAIDAQQFCAVCSVARDTTSDYVAFGHSALVDPWGEVLCEAGEGEEIVSADMDMKQLAAIRMKLPIANGTRSDLYSLKWLEKK